MWTVVGWIDRTDSIPPDSEDNGSESSGGIQANASLSDPNSTWDFHIDDPNQTITLASAMPVIVFDENAPAIGGVPTVPSMNFCYNATLNNIDSSANWDIVGGGAIPDTVWNYSVNYFPRATVSNAPVGTTEYEQFTINFVQGVIVSGVEYMFSMYINSTGAVTNVQAFLNLTFTDGDANFLGPTYSTTITPSTTQVRANVTSGPAPAGTAGAYIQFGIQTTSTTNSGTVVFGTPQLEPMWFLNKGVSYPTPDCNYNQVNSVLLPNGIVSRKCRRFAGYIEDRIVSYAGKQRHYEVKCASSSKLLETIGLFSASYTSTQDTTILTNTLNSTNTSANVYSSIGRLSAGQQNLFSPSSTLINGVVIDSMSWNNATLRRILNDVASQSGSLYFVDAYYYLWYVPPSFSAQTIALSDTPDNITTFPYANFSIEYDYTNPVNTVMVVGSKQKAAVVSDTFSGNGSTTVFNLSYPPENVHALTVGGANVRAGVDGVDNAKFGSTQTYKALINKQAQTLKFATAPTSGTNNVVISYTYEDQVISQVVAADSVGNTNVSFWGLVNDSAITSTTAAKNRGLAELASYAYDRVILNFDLTGIYVPVGSLVLFTNQGEGLTGAPFVIQTVQSDLQGGGVDNWQYTAGVYNPTIIDHLRNATKAIQKSPTTANVVVIASIDVALFDSLHINDSVSATTSPYASSVGIAGYTMGYYRLGENRGTIAYDISGNGNNGTISSGVTLGEPGALTGSGDTNASMLFDGSSGHITLPSSLNPGGWSAISVDFWAKLSGTFSGNPRPVANSHSDVDNLGFQFILNSGGTVTFSVANGTNQVGANSTSTLSSSAWKHICGTWDGTTVKIYINGTLEGTASLGGTLGSSTHPIAIGYNPAYSGDYFPGYLDEVAIQNTALSAGAIAGLYLAGI